MANAFVHTCVRVRDIDASARFYETLGFEERGRLNFDSAYNVYFGLPGDGDRPRADGQRRARRAVRAGGGLQPLRDQGRGPRRPAPSGSRRWASSRRSRRTAPVGATTCRGSPSSPTPTAHRIELIDGGGFATPQDGPHPSDDGLSGRRRRAGPGPARPAGRPPRLGGRAELPRRLPDPRRRPRPHRRAPRPPARDGRGGERRRRRRALRGRRVHARRDRAALSSMTFAIGRRFVIADGVERWKEADVAPVAAAMAGIGRRDAHGRVLRARGGPRQGARRARSRRSRRPAARSPRRARVKPRELPRWLPARPRELGLELDKQARPRADRPGRRAPAAPAARAREARARARRRARTSASRRSRSRAPTSAERKAVDARGRARRRRRAGGDRALLELRAQGERLPGLLYQMVRRLRDALAIAEALAAGQPAGADQARRCGCRRFAADRLIADVVQARRRRRCRARARAAWPTSSSRAAAAGRGCSARTPRRSARSSRSRT